MPQPFIPYDPMEFELCAQTLSACVAARDGGAHRIELCRALEVGGLTPDTALVEAAVRESGLPVHVLLRPHAEHFRATPETVAVIRESLEAVRGVGAAGLVLGFLRADGTVDVEATRAMVQAAAPLPVTFHRAFDEVADQPAALEDVVATGCTRLLTSGGAPDVLAGAAMLARLARLAAGRVDVALGGGLRMENAVEVARVTGASSFHGSLRHAGVGGRPVEPTAETVRAMVRVLAAAQAPGRPQTIGGRCRFAAQ